MPYHAGWWCGRGHDVVRNDAPEKPRPLCPICGQTMISIRGYTDKDIEEARARVFRDHPYINPNRLSRNKKEGE